MTCEEVTLWQKIKAFRIDDNQSSVTFSARLARENGWTADYTARVIEEYKKFLYLCCVSPKEVTPSDAVDQAWHLHLTYTKSYWVDLCRNTLHQDIHHNPTKGGNSEAEKFDDYYTESFKLYQESFGTEPPADIWPGNEKRFSDINFQRVNLKTHGLVKRWVITLVKILLGLSVLALLIFIGQVEPDINLVVLVIVFIAVMIYNTGKQRTSTGSGGDGCSTDSGHGHYGDGGSHGGHGYSSGCSGCSGSGCSGCGGGGD